MRQLLDYPTQRILSILELLFTSKDWLTIKQISAAVDSSERTINNDLYIIKKQWGDITDIEISRQMGVILHNRNISILSKIYVDIFQRTPALLWLELLLFHPFEKFDFYLDQLHLSQSSFMRLIHQSNSFLAEKNMHIQNKNNGYEIITDDEQFLRIFYATFLLELHGFDPDLFYPLEFSTVIPVINSITHSSELYLKVSDIINDEITQMFYCYFYLISLLRENQGYCLTTKNPLTVPIDKIYVNKISSVFKNITGENLSPIHDFIQKQYSGWDSTIEKNMVERESSEFIDRLFFQLNNSPFVETRDTLENILIALYLTAKYRTQKTSTLFDRIYYFGLYAQKQHSLSYDLIRKNLLIFSDVTHVNMDNYVDSTFFWFCLAYPQFRNLRGPRKILIVSDFGKQHSLFLSKTLSYEFNHDKNLTTIIDIAEILDPALSDTAQKYDIIVTTIINLPIKHRHIILINDYPTEENIYQIYMELLKDN